MLAVAFAVAALLAARRGEALAGAALAAIGTAAKLFPVLLLPLLGLAALFRRDASWRDRLTRAAALTLTLTRRDVEEADAAPRALEQRLCRTAAGKHWLTHPKAEAFLAERVALLQRLYKR